MKKDVSMLHTPCAICVAVLAADPSRHFKECIHREAYPVPDPSPRSIYVAGASSERAMVREHIDLLTDWGYTVTFDWTRNHGFDLPQEQQTEATWARLADADLDAVIAAQTLWYLAPGAKSEGSASELGAALVLAKLLSRTVVVSGELGNERMFPRLAKQRFATHAGALEFLRQRALGWS